MGSDELINGLVRYCLWIEDEEAASAAQLAPIKRRLELVTEMRKASSAASTREFAKQAHRFVQSPGIGKSSAILIGGVSSERRQFLPASLVDARTVASNLLFMIRDGELWNLSIITSRMHLVWIANICGKMKTDYRYSNTLGWNTFPVPPLTAQNKLDLTRTAQEILLAREEHFPATIADLYEAGSMPENLRRAHEENDDLLERIFIGRRFRNDSERLEKLFDLYTKLATEKPEPKKKAKRVA